MINKTLIEEVKYIAKLMGISEEKCYLITENAKNNNMKPARRYLEEKLGWNNEQIMDFFGKMKHDIPNVRMSNCKYFLGVTRMIMEKQLTDGESIIKLNSILKYINNDESLNSSFDRNLNGLTFEKLSEQTTEGMEQAYKSERERLGSTDFGERNTSYNIVKINTFKEASEYGKYTPWCVTHEIKAFNDYTNNGICVFYFCLKDGFESIPEKIGENCPLDEYGLSMIAVCVDENGECKTVTCRWNHDNGGNDNIMSTEELSRLLGVNFYEVFKPSTVFKEKLEKALSLAKKGDLSGFDNIYSSNKNGIARVELNNKWNLIDTNGKLVSQRWFDEIENFDRNGFAQVMLNGKLNLIDINGKLVYQQWFDWIDNFNEDGLAIVRLNDKWNLIDINGKLVYQQWFDWIDNFNEDGFAKVKLNDKWNLIDTNGNLLSKQWFDWIYYFKNGIFRVELNNKWNLIDINGKVLSQQWFDEIHNFDKNGIAMVELNDKSNLIDKKGNLLSKQWFDYIYKFDENGLARVELNGRFNFIDINGNFISQQWFDYIYNFDENGIALVELNKKCNLIRTDGNLLFKQWFDDICNYTSSFYMAKLNNKFNLIDKNGKLLSKQWFNNCVDAAELSKNYV